MAKKKRHSIYIRDENMLIMYVMNITILQTFLYIKFVNSFQCMIAQLYETCKHENEKKRIKGANLRKGPEKSKKK